MYIHMDGWYARYGDITCVRGRLRGFIRFASLLRFFFLPCQKKTDQAISGNNSDEMTCKCEQIKFLVIIRSVMKVNKNCGSAN